MHPIRLHHLLLLVSILLAGSRAFSQPLPLQGGPGVEPVVGLDELRWEGGRVWPDRREPIAGGTSVADLKPWLVQSGFGMEIGIGHNELRWSGDSAQPDHRDLYLKPSLRIFYNVPVEDGWTVLVPFIEYQEFGGRRITEETEETPTGPLTYSMDTRYRFRAISIGALAMIRMFPPFGLGTGIKLNYHIAKHGVGLFTFSGAGDKVLEAEEELRGFDRVSSEFGMRAEWEGWPRITLAGEVWFGLGGLETDMQEIFVQVRHTQYRFLLGYHF